MGSERRNERVEPHVAVGVRAKPSAVCVCVCASLTVCLPVCVCWCVVGRQNETCAPHFVSVSCQTCWKKVRLSLIFVFSLSFISSRAGLTLLLCVFFVLLRVVVVADVRVVIVVVACGAVQLDYFKGKEGGLNVRAWLAPGTSISLSHI